MSYVRIWLHCVWATKNRIPYLTGSLRSEVISHIYENAKGKGIFIDQMNGYKEHLHALISLGKTQNIAEIMQMIKGESSYWINKTSLTKLKFGWQDDFYCVSIGESQVEKVREYIRTQDKHHEKISWREEIDKFIKENNFVLIRD
jgi:putative transposase